MFIAMENKIQVAYGSTRGRRQTNEDMFGVPKYIAEATQTNMGSRGFAIDHINRAKLSARGNLFIVADGVGGHGDGDKASQIAVEEVGALYYADKNKDLAVSLQHAIEKANSAIYIYRGDCRMATTLTAIVVLHGSLLVANVGDSRCYLIEENAPPLQLTDDHSWIREQVDCGRMTIDEALTSPNRNKIVRSVGGRHKVSVDIWEYERPHHGRLLLCSDGLSGYLSQDQLSTLTWHRNLQIAVNQLIDTAYDQGSPDNISAILVETRDL